MKVCIPKENIKKFREALKKKDISMGDLMHLSTTELHKKLAPYAGKNTKDVVLLFEQKRILKNKVLGLKNAVSKVGEIGRYDPQKAIEIKKVVEDFKAQNRKRILSPNETQTFYNALADKILGTHVTAIEAKRMFTLETNASNLESKIQVGKTPKDSSIRTKAGSARYLVDKYHQQLVDGNADLKTLLMSFKSETKQRFKEDKLNATGKLMSQTINFISDMAVTMKATWDISYMGRQGLNVLKTHPTLWYKMALQNNKDFVNTLRKQDAEAGMMADMYSRDNFLNGEYQIAKIIPKSEEPIPTRVHERIPIVGGLFKASDVAFINGALKSRIDLYDFFKERAKKNGIKWDKAQIEDIGTLINSLTARGGLDNPTGGVLKVLFWAPKMLKASWDVRTAHTFGIGLKTKFARQEAFKNMAKVVMTDALVIGIANAIKPGSAETDPRSSNFGTIKVGNTTFDYTGGAKSLAVLGAQMVTGEKKSSNTGVITKLGSGFGQQSRFDAVVNFGVGKTKPALNVLIQILRGRTYQNTKPTFGSVVKSLFVPISVENSIQLKDNHSVSAVAGVMLDLFGINANTRKVSTTNWNMNPSDELKQFKAKVGNDAFKKANKQYNDVMSKWIVTVRKNTRYQQLSTKDKKALITAKRSRVKKDIFMKHSFRKKRTRSNTRTIRNSLLR